MHRRFIKNASFLIIINLIIKPVYILGIDREVQNVIGPTEYGVFFALFNFSYLFHIINDFGIQSFNARFIAQNPKSVTEKLGQFFTIKLYLAVIYLLIIFSTAYLLNYSSHFYPLLAILAFNHICIGMVFYLRSNLTGLSRFRGDAWLSIADRSLMIGIVGVILLIPSFRFKMNIYHFVFAQTFSLLVAISFGLYLIRDKLPKFRVVRISMEQIWSTLKSTWPFAVTVFLMTLYTRLDGVMIERLLDEGDTEAGIYASGYRLLDASNMVIFLIASLLLPMFSNAWNDTQKMTNLFRSGFRLIILITIPVAILGYTFSAEIIPWLYVHAQAYWGEVFGVLILTFISTGVIYLFSTYLTASGNLKRMNRWFLLGIIANIILNFALIPALKAYGAAIATLITQSFIALILTFEAKSSWAYLRQIMWFRWIIFTLLSVCLPYILKHVLQLHWMIEFLLSGALIGAAVFILGLMKKETIISLLFARNAESADK